MKQTCHFYFLAFCVYLTVPEQIQAGNMRKERGYDTQQTSPKPGTIAVVQYAFLTTRSPDAQPDLSYMHYGYWLIDNEVTVQNKVTVRIKKIVKYIYTFEKVIWKKTAIRIKEKKFGEASQIDTGPLFGPHLCLHLLKNMNHSFRVWLQTSFPVGVCNQPTWAQHWLNGQVCSEKGDMWRWQMARCWQWVAGRLPVSQFTWRFIKHFGQAPLERPRSGVTWSPAWGIL